MNKRQKEMLQNELKNEKTVLNQIKAVYQRALIDIEEKIDKMQIRIDKDATDTAAIYQKQYQEALKKQVSAILDKMNADQYDSIQDYLEKCYEDAFVGNMYDLHGQGIPLIFPIDQNKVAKAIQHDTKLSKPLYQSLGYNVDELKKTIAGEISRGIANGYSYGQIARNIRENAGVTRRKSLTIARTEGHRIQEEARHESQKQAKDAGADIVKQWDSTLDKRTRPTHQKLDGQIRELDEPFEVNGMKAMYPSGFGKAKEDINCRCVALQRARWALDEEELDTLKKRAEFFGLDKAKNLEEFKKKYLNLPENANKMNVDTLPEPTGSSNPVYDKFFKTLKDKLKVAYNPVTNRKTAFSEEQIISELGGGDLTTGSCASLGLAYIGQKKGWNVLDFRGGESQGFFSTAYNLKGLFETEGIKKLTATGANTSTVGKNLLKQCEVGKEYYLYVGRHAAIVRKKEDGVLQYLELQSRSDNGWHDFDGNVRYTLKWRFGCSQAKAPWSKDLHGMIDIQESNFETDEFKQILGYINTAESEQRKGVHGTIK